MSGSKKQQGDTMTNKLAFTRQIALILALIAIPGLSSLAGAGYCVSGFFQRFFPRCDSGTKWGHYSNP